MAVEYVTYDLEKKRINWEIVQDFYTDWRLGPILADILKLASTNQEGTFLKTGILWPNDTLVERGYVELSRAKFISEQNCRFNRNDQIELRLGGSAVRVSFPEVILVARHGITTTIINGRRWMPRMRNELIARR